jgi:hypothetical protein
MGKEAIVDLDWSVDHVLATTNSIFNM